MGTVPIGDTRLGNGVPNGASTIYLDTETTGLDPRADELVLVGFAADDAEPVALRHPDDRELIQAWLELDADYVAHNVGFDLAFLERAGYPIPAAGALARHGAGRARRRRAQAGPDRAAAAGHRS